MFIFIPLPVSVKSDLVFDEIKLKPLKFSELAALRRRGLLV
jgi:hypothetical protein